MDLQNLSEKELWEIVEDDSMQPITQEAINELNVRDAKQEEASEQTNQPKQSREKPVETLLTGKL